MTEVWTKWEGQVINGVFLLRRLLSASDHSAVFLTEYKAHNLPNAALKLVPAIPTLAQAQLSQWTTAATLSHPHLIRLLETGRCQLGGLPFLFVVMEYAEQTLSQILAQRALTPDEVREMLLPTLNALAFLHRKNLVQGRLKPSNILAVNDQLKLASDAIRPAGESPADIAKSSVYDPPEAKDGSFSPAGDIWGLGITMVEALTQHPPSWPDSKSESASFPAAFSPPFVEIVRQCLNRNPANRPTVADVEAWIKPAPQSPVVPVPQPPLSAPKPLVSTPKPLVPTAKPLVSIPAPLVREVPDKATAPEKSPKQRWLVPAIAVLLIAVAAVWVGLHWRSSHTSLERAAPPAAAPPAAPSQIPETSLSAPPQLSAPASGAKSADSESAPSRFVSHPSDRPAQPPANRSPSVLHEVIPDVPRRARDTIRGHITVTVRVTVDSSGNVVDETLGNPGPSKYFARLATEAARKWKFAPADNQDSRKWLLRFDFTRGGVTGRAATPRS
jgi:TonB family protein